MYISIEILSETFLIIYFLLYLNGNSTLVWKQNPSHQQIMVTFRPTCDIAWVEYTFSCVTLQFRVLKQLFKMSF